MYVSNFHANKGKQLSIISAEQQNFLIMIYVDIQRYAIFTTHTCGGFLLTLNRQKV